MKTGDVIKVGVGLGVLYVAYKIYEGLGQAASYVSDVAANVSDSIGETAANLIIGDTNAQASDTFTQVKAALNAAGNPQVGSQQYNDIVAQFGIAPAPAPVGK